MKDLTPFGQWLLDKWPLVWKKDYKKLKMNMTSVVNDNISLRRDCDILHNELDYNAELVSRQFPLPDCRFTEDSLSEGKVVTAKRLTITMNPLHFYVAGMPLPRYSQIMKDYIIKQMVKTFSLSLAERFVDELSRNSTN